MLERAINDRDLRSVFYLHNLRLAEKWEVYCLKHNGEITGIVNSHILEFQLSCTLNNLKVQLKGISQRSNVNAGRSYGFSFVKNTVIIVSKVYYGRGSWEIYRTNKIRNLFHKIIGKCEFYNGYNGYSIASKKDIEITKDILELKAFFEISEIRSISYSNEIIRVEYFTLLGVLSFEKVISLFHSRF